jgi:hypothetical protein
MSKQLDIIVINDVTPRFSPNREESAKSFAPIEGTLGVVSIKSYLDRDQLEDCLSGIASIPNTMPLDGRHSILLQINNYEDWPIKIIFAYDGISHKTILHHINSYYQSNSQIPNFRKPNLIHVAGKYVLVKGNNDLFSFNPITREKTPIPDGTFAAFDTRPDLQAIARTIEIFQERADISSHIHFNYRKIINRACGIDDI